MDMPSENLIRDYFGFPTRHRISVRVKTERVIKLLKKSQYTKLLIASISSNFAIFRGVLLVNIRDICNIC